MAINGVAYLGHHELVERCVRVGQSGSNLRWIPIGYVLEVTIVVVLVKLAVVEPNICERYSSLEISLEAIDNIHKVKSIGIVSTQRIGLGLRELCNLCVKAIACLA